jgi:biotin transport system substrate-specific component
MLRQTITSKISDISVIKVIAGFLLIFASAQIIIPIEPVPITLQTVGVMLIALTYNMSEGIAALIFYIIGGAIGLPIFSNFSHGLGGPTSGYIMGFIPAIYLMNKFKDRYGIKSFSSIVSACFIGHVVIYLCGITWLSTLIGFMPAVTHGLIPFIIPGVVKLLILSASLRAIGFKR